MTQGNWENDLRPFETARVLVAENDPSGQDLARRCLEQFGCSIDVADDGVETIRLFQLNRYDIVLVSCQMTDLDSFDAARRIWEFEQHRARGTRIPIIGLMKTPTAEEREACFAAGMDGWIGKPFTVEHLWTVLERWLLRPNRSGAVRIRNKTAAVPVPTVASVEAKASATVIDQTTLDSIRALATPDNPDILTRIVETYLSSATQLLDNLARAAACGDASALSSAVNSLKSSSANVGAVGISELCRELEYHSRRGGPEQIPSLCDQIAHEFETVRAALEAQVNTGSVN